jgi:hypothetical protein
VYLMIQNMLKGVPAVIFLSIFCCLVFIRCENFNSFEDVDYDYDGVVLKGS